MSAFCVIDVQGFPLNDGFMVKELAITDGKLTNHFVFKAQVPYCQLTINEKQQVDWLECNHHSLRYDDGHVHLSELSDILQRFTAHYKFILVKGHQKVALLKQFIVNIPIINLEHTENISKLTKVTSNCCMYHSNKFSFCSIANVKSISEKLIN